ncbi:BlaI/MecI/CopY family transcriptional regulator [Labedella endophytica]|uniref:Transcriptional regulator n=1 Tax=Labedella endophytica TaxID=1523160 RepID=A0A433JNS8_9MICO|nr:BlaI/MecI/CopY family transcriptional regulator [Labedella endophytica]RUQ97166.1 transcriptional regulator [Labedella endophytica]
MAQLGELERSIMDALWASENPLSATELQEYLEERARETSGKQLAVTTVLTVLSRLEHKSLVVRDRTVRPHLYRASSSQADHTAELMHEILGSSTDRGEVLARFLGSVSPEEAAALRGLLDQTRDSGRSA